MHRAHRSLRAQLQLSSRGAVRAALVAGCVIARQDREGGGGGGGGGGREAIAAAAAVLLLLLLLGRGRCCGGGDGDLGSEGPGVPLQRQLDGQAPLTLVVEAVVALLAAALVAVDAGCEALAVQLQAAAVLAVARPAARRGRRGRHGRRRGQQGRRLRQGQGERRSRGDQRELLLPGQERCRPLLLRGGEVCWLQRVALLRLCCGQRRQGGWEGGGRRLRRQAGARSSPRLTQQRAAQRMQRREDGQRQQLPTAGRRGRRRGHRGRH